MPVWGPFPGAGGGAAGPPRQHPGAGGGAQGPVLRCVRLAVGNFTAHPKRAGVKYRAAGPPCPAGPVSGSRGVFGCIL